MLRIPGRIPIVIHPIFWLTAALIGYLNSFSFIGTLIWTGAIFLSVLFHEWGHALTAAFFGCRPRIELVALGGLTYHDGDRLPFWKQFFIVLDGPLFGFLLFLAAAWLLPMTSGLAHAVLQVFWWINLYWTVLNLLPILPLDGGQLLRIVLEGLCGVRGVRYALIASIVIALGASLFFFLYQLLFPGALFFLFAFQSYDAYRRTRQLTEQDNRAELRALLDAAEAHLQAGRKEEALDACRKIRSQVKKGVLYVLASQYAAFILYDRGDAKGAYDLLRPLRAQLSADALCLLHRAAFEQQDDALVVELAGACYQSWPGFETALRNACASARLAQVRPAIGWLQAAVHEGVDNLPDILKETAFDAIRSDPRFQAFVHSLHPHS
jgi:Zn-dependent protease